MAITAEKIRGGAVCPTAEGTVPLRWLWVDLLGEQARHNLEVTRAFGRAVAWEHVLQAPSPELERPPPLDDDREGGARTLRQVAADQPVETDLAPEQPVDPDERLRELREALLQVPSAARLVRQMVSLAARDQPAPLFPPPPLRPRPNLAPSPPSGRSNPGKKISQEGRLASSADCPSSSSSARRLSASRPIVATARSPAAAATVDPAVAASSRRRPRSSSHCSAWPT